MIEKQKRDIRVITNETIDTALQTYLTARKELAGLFRMGMGDKGLNADYVDDTWHYDPTHGEINLNVFDDLAGTDCSETVWLKYGYEAAGYTLLYATEYRSDHQFDHAKFYLVKTNNKVVK